MYPVGKGSPQAGKNKTSASSCPNPRYRPAATGCLTPRPLTFVSSKILSSERLQLDQEERSRWRMQIYCPLLPRPLCADTARIAVHRRRHQREHLLEDASAWLRSNATYLRPHVSSETIYPSHQRRYWQQATATPRSFAMVCSRC